MLLSIFNFINISSGSEICNPLLEILVTFGTKIIGNLCSESRKRHFWGPKFQNFSGGARPQTPLVKSASGARLSTGQAICIRNPSMQKGWLRPCKRLLWHSSPYSSRSSSRLSGIQTTWQAHFTCAFCKRLCAQDAGPLQDLTRF